MFHARFKTADKLSKVLALSFSQACPGKSGVKSADRLDITVAVDLEVKAA